MGILRTFESRLVGTGLSGGCAIALKSGGWSRNFRVAMPDVESESEADRAARTLRLRGRLLGLATAGWSSGTRFADRRRAIPTSGAFPDPVTRLIDEAQRLRFSKTARTSRAKRSLRSPTSRHRRTRAASSV